jgi:Ca2+-binding RTX toxin-like protein
MLPRRPKTRCLPAVLAVGVAALAAAPASFGASAEVTNGAAIFDVDLANPFAQDLVVEFKNNQYIFTDSGSEPRINFKAKSGCEKGDGTQFLCTGSGVTRVKVEVENADDVVTVGEGVTVPVTFSLGQGGDQATGGPAGDTFLGGTLIGLGNDTMEGKAGDDTFFAGLNADVMDGGEGTDTLDMSARALRETVILDDEANDGDPTDLASLDSAALSGADNAKGIENVIGGTAKDTLTGNDSANKLDGGNAADTLEGRGGADTLIGGNGNDVINARTPTDGVKDPDAVISCGGGQDHVTADPEDGPAIAADCEDIDCGNCEVPPAGSPPNTPSPAPEIAAIDPPGGANDADEGSGPGGSGDPPDPDGAGPEQAPPASPPEVQIVSNGVVPLKSNGRIPVRIFCIYRADHCGGSLTLKTTAGIKVKVGRKTRTIAKNTTISSADLAPIRWGNSDPVQLKASPLFRALLPLLKKPSTKVKAILVSRDTAGGSDAPEARATGEITVAAKPARKRK